VVLPEGLELTVRGDPPEQWYYCLDHRTVESPEGCQVTVRIGPFPTRDEAARALEIVERRNQEWDDDDAVWDEED
jgi:hypothetical protein